MHVLASYIVALVIAVNVTDRMYKSIKRKMVHKISMKLKQNLTENLSAL